MNPKIKQLKQKGRSIFPLIYKECILDDSIVNLTQEEYENLSDIDDDRIYITENNVYRGYDLIYERPESYILATYNNTSSTTQYTTIYNTSRIEIVDNSQIETISDEEDYHIKDISINLEAVETNESTGIEVSVEDESDVVTINDNSSNYKYLEPGENTFKIYVNPQTTTLEALFRECTYLTKCDLSHLNTSHVTNMDYMFYGCSNLTEVNFEGINTRNVKSMIYTFMNCTSLASIDVSPLNTKNVTTFEAMFFGCTSLKTIDISMWNTDSCTVLDYMFMRCSALTSISWSNIAPGNRLSAAHLFRECSSLATCDISQLTNVSQLYNMCDTFRSCPKLAIYCNKLITKYVEDASYAFFGNNAGKGIYNADQMDLTNATTIYGIFSSSYYRSTGFPKTSDKLVDAGAVFNTTILSNGSDHVDFSNANFSNVTNMFTFWAYAQTTALKTVDYTGLDLSKVENMRAMFYQCPGLTTVRFNSNIDKVNNVINLFVNTTTTGTLYYPSKYDYSKIINELPSTWTAIAE